LKFLVDMPVTPQAVPHLEGKGHETAHAASSGLATEPDSALLEHARQHAQIVITADLDFPRLLATHKRVLERVSEHDLQHSITVVDQSRIRVHRLPVAD
jgi:predicted nuclease of predicted toxin-antitoxin system